MNKIFYLTFIILFLAQLNHAQNDTMGIPMDALKWETFSGTSTFENFEGRKTMLLNGKAILKDTQLKNGIIEVDVYANKNRSFAGIIFRKQNNTMEEVYMRLHKSNQPDALQYSPTFNNELTWQLYREYQANITFKNKGWNNLRIEIGTATAVIFVNDKKVLVVDNLRTDNTLGEIGLFSLFENRFSNFRFSKKTVENHVNTNSEFKTKNGIVKQWQITKAFPFKESDIDFNKFSKEKYVTASTENSGLLTFSKYIKKPSAGAFEQNNEVYSVAKLTIESDANTTKLFSFDYSDKIVVYLNGKEIFKGNNAFRSKGNQYQGHLDINANALYLNLEKGKNLLHCVVIDKANGWGLMGKLE